MAVLSIAASASCSCLPFFRGLRVLLRACCGGQWAVGKEVSLGAIFVKDFKHIDEHPPFGFGNRDGVCKWYRTADDVHTPCGGEFNPVDITTRCSLGRGDGRMRLASP